MSDYNHLLVERDGATLIITINRPENGNKFNQQTCLELLDVLQTLRLDHTLQTAVLTGAGDKFFCIGGEHEPMTRLDQSQVLPMVDVYQAIDTITKPVIAAVNGFAVGGGNVLNTVCDLSVAAENAVFRQVGPMVGSFDAGYGTWYLEDTIGRKRAKEMWFLNDKYSAEEALGWGIVNKVVPRGEAVNEAVKIAHRINQRSPLAVGSLKAAFSARHNGVSGQARMAHDQQLTLYLSTQEAHELGHSFAERREPDSERFWK